MSCMRLNMAEAVGSDSNSIGTAKVDQRNPHHLVASACLTYTDSAYKYGAIKVYVPMVQLVTLLFTRKI